ncbi:Hypothetical protein D9617_14g076960 [Elsinoe fawcettii]|nr:Hypothetical protein D9617_14g076960 [Elsinoe fawcettii]
MSDQIGEPYELLGLPKPFGGADSRTQAEAVWQYSPTRIRLRSEVVVAVDGEGLYIYDIDNPRLITSYAVSPETKFLCPPVSLIRKRADRKLERVTYAAVQLRDSQKSRIICFAEERRKQAAQAMEQPAWKQLEIEIPEDASILALLAVPVDLTALDVAGALQLCVVHKQHRIESYAGDLSRRHFLYKRESPMDKQQSHEFATVLSLKTLRKGLLKERQDVAASLESTGIDDDQPNILLLIQNERNQQKNSDRRTVSLARLVGKTSLDDPGAFLKRHGLVKVQRLPSIQADEAVRFAISNEGLQLSAQAGSSFWSWDLQNQDLSASGLSLDEIVSHLNLGHSEVLLSTKKACSLYNTHWKVERTRFEVATSGAKAGEKRPRGSASISLDDIRFIQHFDHANIAVALSKDALIGVSLAISSSVKKRRTEMTLADAVGKGKAVTPGRHGLTDAAFAGQVRSLVQVGKVIELENLIATQIGLQARTDEHEAVPKGEVNGNGAPASSSTTVWDFPKDESLVLKRTDPSKAATVLHECVSFDVQSRDKPFSLRLYSDTIFRWLAISGVLSSSFGGDLDTGSLMTALSDYDPTLATMETVLRWQFHLNISEVVRALSTAIDSLDSPIPSMNQIEDVEEEAANQPDDDSIADAAQAAEDDLAFAIASLNHGTAIRSGLLKSIFDRLFAFPPKDIVNAFKSMLTPRELVFLINLLRIELADGGWTTRYIDERYEDDMDDGPADNSISIIIKLLNSAVDAVGPTGWNVGLSSDKQLNTDEMLLVLRAEVNAALDGCQEYQSIADALQEFTKFSVLAKPFSHRKKKKVDPVRNPGFIKDEVEDVLLPLGARLDRIESTRVSKGGKVDVKSKNQIGQEISMRVGQYTIDKIRV